MRIRSQIRRAAGDARRAFSLIEMMVVVLIISVLAGMILYIVTAASAHNAKATTIENIEKVRAALEEFYAVYGQYPPVVCAYNKPNMAWSFPDPNATNQNGQTLQQVLQAGQTTGFSFQFGLVSFLVDRVNGNSQYGISGAWKVLSGIGPQLFQSTGSYGVQWAANNGYYDPVTHNPMTPPRDQAAINRWLPMFQTARGTIFSSPEDLTGMGCTVRDGWGHELYYWSTPPYQTYDLWSTGPDGASGGPLSNIADQQAAKDDIHSSPGR